MAGSEAVACFRNVQRVTKVVLASLRISVQPAGGATTKVPVGFSAPTNATSWSPSRTPAGAAGLIVAVVVVAAALMERKAGSIT